MRCVELLAALIAGRDFQIRNVHIKHSMGRVCGVDLELHFECGLIEEFQSGVPERSDLEFLLVWLYRVMSGDKNSVIEVVGEWGE